MTVLSGFSRGSRRETWEEVPASGGAQGSSPSSPEGGSGGTSAGPAARRGPWGRALAPPEADSPNGRFRGDPAAVAWRGAGPGKAAQKTSQATWLRRVRLGPHDQWPVWGACRASCPQGCGRVSLPGPLACCVVSLEGGAGVHPPPGDSLPRTRRPYSKALSGFPGVPAEKPGVWSLTRRPRGIELGSPARPPRGTPAGRRVKPTDLRHGDRASAAYLVHPGRMGGQRPLTTAGRRVR